MLLVGGDHADGADRLRRAQLRLDAQEQLVELVLLQRLLSSSALAIRSSAGRCFCRRRIASAYASSVSRACSWSRSFFVSSESA
jgi:hypothetical protein